jgi:hypothetical protein
LNLTDVEIVLKATMRTQWTVDTRQFKAGTDELTDAFTRLAEVVESIGGAAIRCMHRPH